MPTPDELRASIAEAREALRSSIAAAGDRWEVTADDDWTPRKTAEHAIAAEVYFATEVCAACGYPGLDPWPASSSGSSTDDNIVIRGFSAAFGSWKMIW